MEIEVSSAWKSLPSSSVKERGAKVCGRNNSKRREDFVHQAGQSATPKQLEVLAHLLGVHSFRNFLFH